MTGWGKKKGRKDKPTGVGFLLIYHLSYNTNNRRRASSPLLPPAPAHSGSGPWSVNQDASETV